MTTRTRRATLAETTSIPVTPCGTPPSALPHITQITPEGRDVRYDPRAQQAALTVQVQYADGRTVESLLVLTPGQVELLRIQLDQAIALRQEARQ